jgi:hypothetical protein
VSAAMLWGNLWSAVRRFTGYGGEPFQDE